ncbi:hypothetical protein [Pseudonocardia broussonetiae]|uniref:Concanavalin A-like lectin/glucanase superfamily protein n=1 Tax=Pseudonocardia broussonetiae TaxID=2736640 RepID=A0A6M6JW14_9PSEU|nr:hypothetical protein [Pseudonocardia broussonetiae]QJY51247.1 hypothetical protein HOP40_35285 [Pseudonocardia broussonetiae]
MPLPFVVDASSPAHVDGATLSSTVSTAPFDPPGDTVLVACVVANSSVSGTTTATVTDSTGLVWNQRSLANFATTGEEGHASIWTAVLPTAQTGMTVTVTTAGSTSTTRRPSLDVLVLRNANELLIAASAAMATTTLNAATFNFTQAAEDSLLVVAASEWQKRGVPTSSDLTATTFDQPGADGVSGLVGYRQLDDTLGTEPYSVDAFGTSTAAWNIVRLEINPAVPAPVDPTGTAFIPELPGGANVAVEVAWGADLTDTEGIHWVWSDITPDVRQEQRIAVSTGRNDEASASSPARVTMTLDNSTAAYSLGGHSPNWPNVRRNVPVRVSVDPGDGNGSRVVFQGYAVGFTPGWDVATGRVPVVRLEAAGVLRRLIQGKDPLRSSLFRYLTLSSSPAEYWPLEEENTATTATSATGGAAGTFQPIDSGGTLYGKVGWGDDTDNPATGRAVQVSAGGALVLPCRPALFSNHMTISWSMRYTSGSGAFTYFRPSGSPLYLAGTWFTDGTVEFVLTSGFGGTSILNWAQGQPFEWDNVWHHYVLEIEDIGSNTFLTFLYRDGVLIATSSDTGTFPAPTSLEFVGPPNPGGTEDPVSVAHVAVFVGLPDVAALTAAAAAHAGELATVRLERLCDEERVPVDITGTTPSTMGPQLPLALVDLLRECETVDLGILYDGVGPGLRYICRSARENAAVALVLDADQLVGPFEPVDDDQRTVNRATASSSGAKYTHEDATGPMGTQVIGVYDSSVDVNTDDGMVVPSYAEWAVHLGTVEGYRYPTVALDLRATAILAPAVLALEPSTRVTVENVGSVLAAMPTGDVDLLVEGMTMQLSPYGWTVTLRCSPYSPWVVGVLAATTGDTAPELLRLDTDGSVMDSFRSAVATSISVATPSGPLWSTNPDDYPLYLDIGGVRVRATTCVGTASPQTFAVNALGIDRAAGSPVRVWNPPVLGL